MSSITATGSVVTVKAYRGDAKTLLAFNLDKGATKNLAGFTLYCEPPGKPGYYIYNMLRFKDLSQHAQIVTEPPTSSVNAPIHKFRWVHVPGLVHQGVTPVYGKYTYTVTPRYFDENEALEPIDATLSTSLKIEVSPFVDDDLEVGFTRGFTQSQAFVRHFTRKAKIRPPGKDLLFDTTKEAGVNDAGDHFTYAEEYEWLGFTARTRIFDLLKEIIATKALRLEMFAYDLNEPDLIDAVLELAGQGRARVILDNSALHHKKNGSAPEDKVEKLFRQAMKGDADILRGKFGRYAHDKVLIASRKSGNTLTPEKVLTGSTNFSVTGLYVNSNHILIFTDPKVAGWYSQVFNLVWSEDAKAAAFRKAAEASKTFSLGPSSSPRVEITFSPHDEAFATRVLKGIADRIAKEGTQGKITGSVLFAVMGLADGTGPVLPALRTLHQNQKIFSYGISDNPGGIFLYRPASKAGVLVTGKPVKTQLPAPFNQVPNIGGVKHQVHHKVVVCGFNGSDPVVYCGSSNLALKGEQVNGDNLIAIHDEDIATVFAIEALALVDHFDFLDRHATKAKTGPDAPKPADKRAAAANAGWFLSTTDRWTEPYFDLSDLRSVDRRLFA
jgi:phosphatidylserine/phosphatidylglycerophosphate/cardiolipin synthase-like enzyme